MKGKERTAPERRRFLRILVGLALIGTSGALLVSRFLPSKFSEGEYRTLSAYLDTLIPADEFGPGLLALGGSEQFYRFIARDREYRYLFRRGCNWLNRQARRHHSLPLYDLSAPLRAEVITVLEKQPQGTAEYVFFRRSLHDAYQYFYSQPKAWQGLPYGGPPQPRGYPDFTAPPAGGKTS